MGRPAKGDPAMPDQIKYELSFSVIPGPPISKKDMFNVAYLCKGGGEILAKETRELLVPMCGRGLLKMVVIAADEYSNKVKYRIGEGGWTALDMPVFLLGPGATGLLGGELPEALTVKNWLDKKITVNIYVGWDPLPGEEEEETEEQEAEEANQPETSQNPEQGTAQVTPVEQSSSSGQTADPISTFKKLTTSAEQAANEGLRPPSDTYDLDIEE
jgi:hypothetical protein